MAKKRRKRNPISGDEFQDTVMDLAFKAINAELDKRKHKTKLDAILQTKNIARHLITYATDAIKDAQEEEIDLIRET